VTPDEVATYARQRYNAVNDTTFFSDSLMYSFIYDAEMQLARYSNCIRSVYSTTTTAGQQEYPCPANTISIKRITYNGYEVMPRSLKEVLDLTATNAAATGTALIYAIWNEVLYLGPIPDAAQTLKIWSINEPAVVSAASTLDVPTRYHTDLAEYLNWQMCVMDKNYQGAELHRQRWEGPKGILDKARNFERLAVRGTEFSFVRDADRDTDSLVLPR
jgi:hypothetical protein